MTLKTKAFADIITFTRASGGGRFNSAGLFEMVGANAPRFDHDPVTGEPLGILIEEQRTNLLLQSTFAGGGPIPAGWTRPLGTGVSSPVASIYGAADGASAYLQSGTNERPFLNQVSATLAASTTYTLSVLIESVSGSTIAQNAATITLAPAGSTVTFPVCAANPSGGAAGLVTVGRLVVQITTSTTVGNAAFRVGLGCTSGATGTLKFSRPQLEAGSFPTSYIPTEASQVTRAADAASVNTLSPWYNASEGTLFVEASTFATSGTKRVVTLQNINSAERFGLLFNSTGSGEALVSAGGVFQGTSTIPGVTAGAIHKLAGAVSPAGIRGSLDGVNGQNIPLSSLPAPDRLIIGNQQGQSQYINGRIRSIQYFPRRLADSELQEITA